MTLPATGDRKTAGIEISADNFSATVTIGEKHSNYLDNSYAVVASAICTRDFGNF